MPPKFPAYTHTHTSPRNPQLQLFSPPIPSPLSISLPPSLWVVRDGEGGFFQILVKVNRRDSDFRLQTSGFSVVKGSIFLGKGKKNNRNIMWKRSGRAFLITGSVAAASSSSSSVAAALLRPGSCGLYPQPLSSSVLRPTFLAHLRPVEAPSSVGAAPRMSSWGCSSSYSSTGEFPNRGDEAEVRGQPTAAAVATCWNCGTSPPSPSSEPFLVCGVCKSVQPVDVFVDYFQIFGLEKNYELETDNLESKYKDWQKKLHPDLVHTKSEQERSYAAEQSARVIDAYRTLSKPLSRALYLLKLDGLHVDEEKTISDPELLAEVMEIREAVEEANDSQALEQIKSELQEKLQNWSNSFGKAFKDRNFEDAVTSIQRMTYYERAIQETVKKL